MGLHGCICKTLHLVSTKSFVVVGFVILAAVVAVTATVAIAVVVVAVTVTIAIHRIVCLSWFTGFAQIHRGREWLSHLGR